MNSDAHLAKLFTDVERRLFRCPGAGWMMESRTGWLMATAEVHAGVQSVMAIASLSAGVQDAMSIIEAAAATSMMGRRDCAAQARPA